MKKWCTLCFLLVGCLALFSMIWPTTALGTGSDFGSNITWTLDEASGTLTLSGEGEMLNWYPGGMWWQSDSVKHLVIEEGITSVGPTAKVMVNV